MSNLEIGDLVRLKKPAPEERLYLGTVVAIFPDVLGPSLEVLWFNGLTYELDERHFKKASL